MNIKQPLDDLDDLDSFNDQLAAFKETMKNDDLHLTKIEAQEIGLKKDTDKLEVSVTDLNDQMGKQIEEADLKKHALMISKIASDDIDGLYSREHFEKGTRDKRARLGTQLVSPIEEELKKYTYADADLTVKYNDIAHKVSKNLRHGSEKFGFYNGAVSEDGASSKVSSFFGNVFSPGDKAYFYNPKVSSGSQNKLESDTKVAVADCLKKQPNTFKPAKK
jgi:hypothetical protein